MHSNVESEWLILFFEERLRMGFVSGDSPAVFTAEGVKYHETGHGDLTAFYDRLENQQGKLVGVRLYAVRGTERVLDQLPKVSYIGRVPREPVVDIYFVPDAGADVVSTGDQAFGGKWFVAPGGRLALSIDFSYLASGEEDWDSLRNAGSEWVSVAR